MKNIVIISLYLLLSSCLKQKKEMKILNKNEPIVELNIFNDLFNENLDYSSLIDSIQVIKLETIENSLIGSIRKIEFRNGKIYILDDSQSLLIFDSSGHYCNKLNKKGKGSGEYLEMRDFYIDEDGSIRVLSYNTILKYDVNLKFVDQKAINITTTTGREINPINFLPYHDFTFLYTGSFGLKNIDFGKDYALYCINNKKAIVNEYFPIFSNSTMGHKNFYRSNNEINFTNTYGNDTIYQIYDNALIPKIYVNFLDNKISVKDMMEDHAILYNTICENGLCGNLMNVYENSTYLCFKFTKGRYPKQALFNKTNKELKVINIGKSFPFPKIVVEGLFNNSFFTTIDIYMLKTLTNEKYFNDFINIHNLSNLKETDNPLIIKFNFKF